MRVMMNILLLYSFRLLFISSSNVSFFIANEIMDEWKSKKEGDKVILHHVMLFYDHVPLC